MTVREHIVELATQIRVIYALGLITVFGSIIFVPRLAFRIDWLGPLAVAIATYMVAGKIATGALCPRCKGSLSAFLQQAMLSELPRVPMACHTCGLSLHEEIPKRR